MYLVTGHLVTIILCSQFVESADIFGDIHINVNGKLGTQNNYFI